MIPNQPNSGQKVCPKCKNVNPIAAQTCWSCGHIFRTQFAQRPPAAIPQPVPPVVAPPPVYRPKRPIWGWVLGAAVFGILAVGVINARQRINGNGSANVTAEFFYTSFSMSRADLYNDSPNTLYDVDVSVYIPITQYRSNLLDPVVSTQHIKQPVQSAEGIRPGSKMPLNIGRSLLSMDPDDLEVVYSDKPGGPRHYANVRFTKSNNLAKY